MSIKYVDPRKIEHYLSKMSNTRHPQLYLSIRDYHTLVTRFKPRTYYAMHLLRLRYPSGIPGYVDAQNYQYFYYVPEIDLHIDYFELPMHTGPCELHRSYDPRNKDDYAFVLEAKEIERIKWLRVQRKWLSVVKMYTWAGSDYRKLMHTRAVKLKYVIYWDLKLIEAESSTLALELARHELMTQYSLADVQNVVYRQVEELMQVKYPYYSIYDSLPEIDY